LSFGGGARPGTGSVRWFGGGTAGAGAARQATYRSEQEVPVMMKYERSVIRAERVRRVPSHFSWLDQRLVRDGWLRGLSHTARSLYLFLGTVADRQGLSWYGDGRVMVELGMSLAELDGARAELVAADLIAYQMPLYQVLELRARPAGAGVPTQVQRTSPKERAATPAEVSALIRATFGAVGR